MARGTSLVVASSGGVVPVDPWTTVSLAADFTTTANTEQVVPGFAFTPAANLRYLIEGFLLVQTPLTTIGPRPGLNVPTGLLDSGAAFRSPSGTATSDALYNSGLFTGVAAPSTGLPTANLSFLATFDAMILTGPTPVGNFQIMFKSEGAGSLVRLRAGSFFRYRVVT